MFGRRKPSALRGKEYATRKDFEQVFTESMSGLHLLAYLLTADKEKAEECFVGGLADSIRGNPVFREWAHSWSRRSIIKRAISMIRPAPEAANLSGDESSITQAASSDCLTLAGSVTSLAPFSRFVFVMAVLEGYSTVECALLLSTTRQSVMNASAQAIRYVTSLCPGVSDSVGKLPSEWKAFFAAA
jgi:DNA-directed RNA polymerase specialized sigma24 family protein